jgi:hypothetical protein
MAGLLRVFGTVGPFLAVPLFGTIAIFAVFLLGQRVGGNDCGLLAAALLLTSSIFLFQLKEPMSDVPVTAWWLLAIVLVTTAAPVGMLAGGFAATAAILTRPNLAPSPRYGNLHSQLLRLPARLLNAGLFSLGVIPGCIGVAVVNSKLYGSPLSSGYGDMSVLFDVDHFWPNLFRYSRWLIETESPFILLAGFGVILLHRAERQREDATHTTRPAGLSLLFVAFAVTLYACYAFYLPFDNWTFLRFLLPGIALLLVL